MIKMNRYIRLFVILMFGLGIGYGITAIPDNKPGNKMESSMTTKQLTEDLAIVSKGRILFSHHSVGANIIEGIKRIDEEYPEGSRIRVASLEEAAISKGPMLIQFSGGENGDPKGKVDAFAETIRDGTDLKPDLAYMKLCFVDFNPRTDVKDLFSYYKRTIESLKREHPEIRFAHVTVPLKERPTGLKWKLFRLIGKEVWEDEANIKRAEFDRLLKENFKTDPIFDLSTVEATAPDGHLTTFEEKGQSYLSLYPGYTEDGGHLNTVGQQIAGKAAIRFIAEGLKGKVR